MAEWNGNDTQEQLTVRHRSRIEQIRIFFRKFLRMFVYQSDWKMLPMAALIAGLVAFVLRRRFGRDMEGTLMAAFAIVCVCIWNGSFNSIQVICRERDVIKREHRSGMHITSYIMAHMMYQLILCALQTVVTLVVLAQMGMTFPGEGLFTPWLYVDAGITILLITYASDLLSLWISSLVHTTTTAMTIMPFVLIFQLLFSGCLFPLPQGVTPIRKLTVSSPGIKAMASQAKVNDLPYSSVTDMMNIVDDVELGGYVTVGQVLDTLGETENQTVAELRAVSVGEDTAGTNFGEVVDLVAEDPAVQSLREEGITVTTTLGGLMDLAGREETKERIEKKASEALYEPDYAFTRENILKNWLHLAVFVGVFALLSILTLEFIDKDKR